MKRNWILVILFVDLACLLVALAGVMYVKARGDLKPDAWQNTRSSIKFNDPVQTTYPALEATPPPTPETWIAGDTSVSNLSLEEQRRLMGVQPSAIIWEMLQSSREIFSAKQAYTYPARVDWRNVNGQDWTTPVRDQMECGSCVAFATLGAIESRLEIAENNPNLNPDLSEAQMYFCSGNSCSSGWYPAGGMDFARDVGATDETCYPYRGVNQYCSLCPNWQSQARKIYSWYGTANIGHMKKVLAESGPYEATMSVYQDFLRYTGGVYRYTYGAFLGYHAVTIVGYDDTGGYWIAKNSWGKGWGESGWFRIAYGEVGIDGYGFIPLINGPPAAPANVLASDGAFANKVQVTWSPVVDATHYEVHRSTSASGAKTLLGSPATALFDDTTAAAGVTYYYWVKACNSSGCSGFSTSNSGYRANQPPAGFTKSSPASGALMLPAGLALSWNSSNGVGSYEYCIDVTHDNLCGGSWMPVGDSTRAPLGGLRYNTTYSWQVRAVNALGMTYADGGAWWSFTTPPWRIYFPVIGR